MQPIPSKNTQQSGRPWNCGPDRPVAAQSLTALIAAAARRSPEALAVVHHGMTLTYRELTTQADRLALRLHRAGVRTETTVGICVTRGPALVRAVLAVLAAGGAYVPLDPTLPTARLATMLAEAGAAVCLVDEATRGLLAADSSQFIAVDGPELAEVGPAEELFEANKLFSANDQVTSMAPLRAGSGSDLAYVIFTSGSTGRPKGICVEQRSVVDFVVNNAAEYRIEPTSRMLALASIGFDVSVAEIFTALVAGATVVVADDDDRRSPARLQALLLAERITAAELPPSLLGLLDPLALPDLRLVWVGGEAPPAPLVAAWARAGKRVINAYGPTETTVTATLLECGREVADSVPIGRPMANHRVYILDPDGNAVPSGAAGELWIAGPGVARGYLNEPELTADRFRPNPFDPLAGRIYGTGDRVRWNTDGTLDFLGRIDGQLNVHGARVEPGEVESRLLAHPAVLAAAVTTAGEGMAGRLVAGIQLGSERVHPRELTRWCALELPPAAVPSLIRVLPALPLTVSGKVDRAGLKRLVTAKQEGPAPTSARNECEGRVLAIWRELFPDIGSIGVLDDFFEIGGHSLLSMRMLVRLRAEFGVELSLGTLARASTVAALAVEIDGAATVVDPAEAIPQLTARGSRIAPLSRAQQRLWFIDQLAPGRATYHLPVCLRMRGPVDQELLAGAFTATAGRHDVLRTALVSRGGDPVAVVGGMPLAPLRSADLTRIPPEDRDAQLRQIIEADINTPFELDVAPLWRARLVSVDRDDWALIVVVHHAIADGWSLNLFLDEVARHYARLGRKSVAEAELPELRYQYADFAAWQREMLVGDRLSNELEHWREALAGAPRVVELPADRARPAAQTFTAGRVSGTIEPGLGRRLLDLAGRHRVTPFVALLSLFHTLVGRLTGNDDVVIGCPVVGRPDQALESVIGFFVDTVPVRVDLAEVGTTAELLRRTGAAVLDALSHSAAPFDAIVEAVAPPRDAGRNPLVQVAFNLLDYPPEQLRLADVQVDEIPFEPPGSLFDATMYAHQRGSGFALDLVYNSDLYDADRMRAMLDQYIRLVGQAVEGIAIDQFSLVTTTTTTTVRRPASVRPAQRGSVVDRFQHWVGMTPNTTAISAHDGSLSYQQLDRATNALCAILIKTGVGAGTVVGIAATRSVMLPVAILAARKIGAVVALVDASLPPRRQLELADIAEPAVWISLDQAGTNAPAAEHLQRGGTHHLSLPGALDDTDGAVRPPNPPGEQPTDTAFVLFTSGTTGTPVGVLVPAGALTHFIDWYAGQFGLNSADRFVMTSGVAHDPVLRDLLVPLCLGALVSIPSPDVHRAPDLLLDYLLHHRISVLHLTPQLGRVLYRSIIEGADSRSAAVPTLRLVATGGDLLLGRDVAGLATLAPSAELISFYGTTETPQAIAWQPLAGQERRVRIPIGSAIADTDVLVVNTAGSPAGVGEPGEIVVRSSQLAIGYLGGSGRRERFADDPAGGSERIYRTGDLGRYLADGRVEIFGRIDQQVKVRGFRVELAEVVTAMLRQPDVAQAAVLPIREADLEVRLVGYIVPAGDRTDVGDLLARLRTLLPEPAVPSAIVSLPMIPMTANGKLDITALPQPRGRETSAAQFRAARGPAERTIVEIWCQVLDLTTVGIDDNFFDVGGTSLRLVDVQVRLQRAFRCSLSIVDLFQCPTVRSLARLLAADDPPTDETPDMARRIGIRRSRRVARSLPRSAAAEPTAIAQIRR